MCKPTSQRLFFTNANANSVTILDVSNPSTPTLVSDIDMSTFDGGINSVAVQNGIVAAAVEGNAVDDNGVVVFMDTDGTVTGQVTVGVLPDMLTFTPDGNKVITANEGEPNDDYTIDPEGSVSIIDISGGVNAAAVTNITFESLNADIDTLRAAGVRIYGPGASVAQDLEPEFIAVTENNQIAVAVLQENNAIARIDLTNNTLIDVLPLGYKNHGLAFNGFDASNRSAGIDIKPQPTLGMYQPDAIKSVNIDGTDYFVTANEGDSRDYDGFSEELRVEDLFLYSFDYPNFRDVLMEENLGRLKTTTTSPEKSITTIAGVEISGVAPILSYGARSFSIWDAAGNLIFDSGDFIEQKLAELIPDDFNSTNDENGSLKNRSDDKGPEPEAIEIAKLGDDIFALVGLERVGGVMVFDITNPTALAYVSYLNNRDFSVEDVTTSAVGDLGVKDIRYIPVEDSPVDVPLVLTANEVSGTVTIFAVNALPTSTRDILNLSQFDVKIGPNPFVENMNISYELDAISRVSVNLIDVKGRFVKNVINEQQASGAYSFDVNTGNLVPGIYYVLVRVNNRVAALPVVKQ
ncbi:MAG: choice-of-anchor I family protein [Bacteroidota bacterium]